MCGVPASNLYGSAFQVLPSNVTLLIMSPPPRNGGMASSTRFAGVQDADAGRPVELVAREHVEVRAERLDVGRHVVRRLRSVDEDQRAGAVRQPHDLVDRD